MPDPHVVVPLHSGPVASDDRAQIHAFVIADIRGYTSFTNRYGDEAAAALVTRFEAIARHVVHAAGGRVVELRGDEVLAEFGSVRSALQAATGLVGSCIEETVGNADLPALPVGAGVDAGEAVEFSGGYRGGALNMAARLCARAAAGEVLATETATHLAGQVAGLSYARRQRMQLKGLAEPADVVEVRSTSVDEPLRAAFRARVTPPPQPRRQPRRPAFVALAVLAAASAIAALLVTEPWNDTSVRRDPASNQLTLLDPRNDKLRAAATIGGNPAGIAFADAAVWVAEPGSDSVERLPVDGHGTPTRVVGVGGGPTALAAVGNLLWVADSQDGTLSRINMDARQVVGAPVRLGNQPVALAAAGRLVWVVLRDDSAVVPVDTVTAAVGAPITVGAEPAGISATGTDVWVTNFGDATVSHIDAVRRSVVATFHVGSGPVGVTVRDGRVWVANSLDNTVTALDPTTGAVVAVPPAGNGPRYLAAQRGTVWVSNQYDGTVTAIDTKTAATTKEKVGGAPSGLATTTAGLWVASGGYDATAHRGGTVSEYVPGGGGIDPAYYSFGSALEPVYDTFVALRAVGGVDGFTLVPDLAEVMPAVSDDRLTYTFHIRSGIHYSDGTLLRASDFRRGLERSLSLENSDASSLNYYENIMGAAACNARRGRCDLSRGMVTDDAAGTVVIHLSRSDPDLLYKLTRDFAAPVPAGTLNRRVDISRQVIPGTGPYRIAPFAAPGASGAAAATATTKNRIVLVRNRFFREWSRAAQPSGYPDRIVLLSAVGDDSTAHLQKLVRDGKLDVWQGPPSADVDVLSIDYPTLMRYTALPATNYLILNTHKPPFDNIDARRAVAYGVDRANRAFGGAHSARPTCQVLPAGLLGYQPYCPYTSNPAAGKWTGPAVQKARQLVRRSGTWGATVIVVAPTDDIPPRHYALYLASALNHIGYHAVVRSVSLDAYFAAGERSDDGTDIEAQGWGADYPAPSAFLQALLGCRDLPSSSGSKNFCSPALLALMRRALAAQETQPATARRLWAAADRLATDLAGIIPVTNIVQVDMVSPRIRNYQVNGIRGVLLDQIWVR